MKITICGSLKFEAKIQQWHEALALMGYTPYCMVVYPSMKGGNKDWYNLDQKTILDLIHLSKIEESDAIFVVDEHEYIGESTAREMMWACIRGKTIYLASRQEGMRTSLKNPVTANDEYVIKLFNNLKEARGYV